MPHVCDPPALRRVNTKTLAATRFGPSSTATGARWSSRRPLPSCPHAPYPQQAALLSVRTPHVNAPPLTSRMNLSPPATAVGATRVVVELSPNCPLRLNPQQYAAPSASRPQV